MKKILFLQRKESRGSHFRRGFLEERDEYLGNFTYIKNNESCQITFVNINVEERGAINEFA
jgi:succinate dehydrogenase/fumarate reductase flavoprotein subunit